MEAICKSILKDKLELKTATKFPIFVNDVYGFPNVRSLPIISSIEEKIPPNIMNCVTKMKWYLKLLNVGSPYIITDVKYIGLPDYPVNECHGNCYKYLKKNEQNEQNKTAYWQTSGWMMRYNSMNGTVELVYHSLLYKEDYHSLIDITQRHPDVTSVFIGFIPEIKNNKDKKDYAIETSEPYKITEVSINRSSGKKTLKTCCLTFGSGDGEQEIDLNTILFP